jgi:hypothetical protein
MFVRQLNNAKESTYLIIKVACTRYLLVTLLTKQTKCNIILASIQLNHFNETTTQVMCSDIGHFFEEFSDIGYCPI